MIVLSAESLDLLVLGGELGECLGLEGGKVGDRLVSVGQPFSERVDLGFEPLDLGVAPVGEAACLESWVWSRGSNSSRRWAQGRVP
ncbi:hypothetical protein ACFXJ8_37735 [Nonomuraea sp. NPDC059194]|uniref:hypothetical protein n=1 Tax=Nonomuraea sp. NPDC059194 TaxID=3346764 RepID=UPI0036CA7957